jgi:hypothetical protein
MASLTPSPTQPSVGAQVSFAGDGFTPAATVTLEVQEEGFSSEIVADAAGEFGSSDIADHAVTTLTLTGNAVAAETVVIGAVTYTWRAAPTTTANEVKVGTTAEESIANLKAAINLEAGSGTKYGSATTKHPTVEAFSADATHLKLRAATGGTAGNALASTETMTNGSFPGATFNSGTPGSAATGIDTVIWTPSRPGMFHVRATDGTNTATCTVQVWS